MRLLFLPLILLTLPAAMCTTEPEVRTVEVRIPVREPPCNARTQLGPRRTHPDTDEALRTARNVYERGRLLLAGRESRIAREEALEDAIDVCSR